MSVFTAVSDQQVADMLSQYELGDLVSVEGISAGIENSNFFVQTTANHLVLTLFEKHTAEELPFFLQLINFLHQKQVKTAQIYADQSGQLIQTVAGKPAIFSQRLNGVTLTDANAAQCEVIGEQIATIHTLTHDYPHQMKHSRDGRWRNQAYEQLKPVLSAEDLTLIEQELEAQAGIPNQRLPRSIIHADLFCDNAMFATADDAQLSGIIDWYFACYGSCLYDLAVIVNDWCFAQDQADWVWQQNHYDAFLTAYQAIRPLTELEQQHWPMMLRVAALRFWLSRLLDKHFPREGDMVFVKEPDEYKTILRHHITEQST